MRDKRGRFIDLAEKRVTRVIKDLQLVGNLSNRQNYEYTETDVEKILGTLDRAVRELKRRFQDEATDKGMQFRL